MLTHSVYIVWNIAKTTSVKYFAQGKRIWYWRDKEVETDEK